MNRMSESIERRMATKMTNLGVPSSVDFYKHSKSDPDKYKLGMNEHDCISCNKHKTGKVPLNKRCQTICGNNIKKIVMNTHSRGKHERIYTIEIQQTTKT